MGKRGNRIKKRNRKRKEAEENNRNRTKTRNRVLDLEPSVFKGIKNAVEENKTYENIVAELKEWRENNDL